MHATKSTRERRHWADVAGILAGVWAIGQAIWGPAVFIENVQDQGLGWNWIAYAIGGGLAIAGVIVAQRLRAPGRILVGLGGLLHLTTPFAYGDLPTFTIINSLLVGVVLLIASPFVGPLPRGVPRPEDAETGL